MKSILKNKTLNLRSPIFWRITAGVFVSILLIELILLIYSWSTERERLVVRLGESATTLSSLLSRDNPLPQLDYLLSSSNKAEKFEITAYSYKSPSGVVSTKNLATESDFRISNDTSGHFDSGTGIYHSTVTRQISPGTSDTVALQVDASWVNKYMRDYVRRIIGMVILISLFVTAGCLLILTPMLINPLQRLNNLLIRGEKQGIRSARSNQKDLNRTDELGSVYRSFDVLRNNLIATEEEKNSVTERFEDFANLGADCFWEVDSRLRFIYFSGDAERVLSLNSDQVVGHSFNNFMSLLDESVPHSDKIFSALAKQGQWEGVIIPKSDNPESDDIGSPISIRIVASARRGASGRITGFRGTIVDITKEKVLAAELKYQATHDALTDLYNRRELDAQLDYYVEKYKRDNQEFSLMVLDLDRFKLVNDGGGHAAGDALLKTFAKTIKSRVADNGIVARLGGDEFAVLFTTSDLNSAVSIAEDIRQTIEAYTFNWNGVNYTVGISAGIAPISEAIDSREAIAFAADACLMKAKRSGRNQVKVYSDGDADFHLFQDEAVWISRIANAIEDDTFVLFQQSIIRINNPDGENHFEILLRMKNPDGGIWTPNLFLPVAERNYLMPKIDQWVVTNAVKWLKTQTINDGDKFCMNVNLSAESLADSRFCDFLIEFFQENQSISKYVCLEMTETAAMVNFDETLDLLTRLKQLGCVIALDDFGTGFSSLSHIRELPLDYIKIDGVFIKDICTSELDQTLVKSVADIAKVLQIKTVAEFVDTDAALEKLGQLDIDYAQGFLFSKPQELSVDDPGQLPMAA